jgi:hypothetical protein
MGTGSETIANRPDYRRWLRGTLLVIAGVVVLRFVTELAGVAPATTRFFSSTVGTLYAAIYLGSIATLRGAKKFTQLILPAFILSGWSVGWVIVATIISAILKVERIHFAQPEDYGNWRHLAGHLGGHVVEAIILGVIVLLLMSIPFFLRRWPIVVGPAAMLGVLLITRFWLEAMQLPEWRQSAWSTTVGVLLSAFFLGGLAAKFGLTRGSQLLVPSLVLGWVWRLWVYLATLFAAAMPFFHSHFFDPAGDRIPIRLVRALGVSVVEGFIAGLLLWGIALWIQKALADPER